MQLVKKPQFKDTFLVTTILILTALTLLLNVFLVITI